MSLPDSFIARTKQILNDEYNAFEAALSTSAPTSIRVNNKTDYHPSNEIVSHCPNGYYLAERPLFTADTLFHGGAYYVQEASSMFLYQAIKQCFPNANRVLDLCAAPGGKSTLLTQTLPDDCLLVSNEIIHSRAQILAENILKWGNTNVVVTNNEASHFSKLEHYFDAIVIDAPCSGEGMFRKDPNAINEWSLDNVMNCVSRQRDILIDSWDALKPGGILVYSTCTFNREENEENVHWICNELGAEIIKLDIEDDKIVTTDGGYRFYPHRVKGEGFFMAVIRKYKTTIKEQKFKLQLDKNTKKIDASELPFKLMDFTQFMYYN
ncbi:MAG: RsmB/NOP family class I SAM-dependent RNA methyltransferase, partial [Paludibacter sp.]